MSETPMSEELVSLDALDLEQEFAEFVVETPVDDDTQVVEEAPSAPQVNEQEAAMLLLYDALHKLGVGQDRIDGWKEHYGAIYVFAPTENDVYVWRPLYKKEWDQIQAQVPKNPDPDMQAKINERMERIVAQKCTIWPPLNDEQLQGSRAGLIPTLFEIIMQGSYFLSPQYAMSLVTEL